MQASEYICCHKKLLAVIQLVESDDCSYFMLKSLVALNFVGFFVITACDIPLTIPILSKIYYTFIVP